MQQLSLLPSSAAPQTDSAGVPLARQDGENPGFKQAFGDAENALKTVQPDKVIVREGVHSDLAVGGESTAASSETGSELPYNSEGLPFDSGNALPQQARVQGSEQAVLALGVANLVTTGSQASEIGVTRMAAAASGEPLASAISALSASNGSALASNGSALNNAKGEGAGVGILTAATSMETSAASSAPPGLTSYVQANSETGLRGDVLQSEFSSTKAGNIEASPASGAPAGLTNYVQANSETGLRGDVLQNEFSSTPTQAGNNTSPPSTAQNKVNGIFQFEINGNGQMSETANSKLVELAAKPSAEVDAQTALVHSSSTAATMKAAATALPAQAENANVNALSEVNPNALASASEHARFNKSFGGELVTGPDPVNGLQAEPELRFKAAMESIQAPRVADATDSVDINAIKLDVSGQVSKGAELKATEAQASARPYVSSLGIPVDDSEWSNQLGQKLMWMSARNIQSAELHLNPADLGPIDVRIQVGADQSSISFNTHNQGVRELLEANIHRLREMLNNPTQPEGNNSGGGSLAQDSSAQSQSQSQSDGESLARGSGNYGAAESGEPETDIESRSVQAEDRLVDAYV